MFDSSVIAMQTSGLLNNPEERTNAKKYASHLAEVIENDGIGHFFDESDAMHLCQYVVSLVEALDIARKDKK
jgi:hypothetical protein